MSKTSMPPSVFLADSVNRDCCRVLSYWRAPPTTPQVTIGDNMSARALGLIRQKTGIAGRKLRQSGEKSGKSNSGRCFTFTGRSGNGYSSIRAGRGGRYLTPGFGYQILTITGHVQNVWHQDTAKSQTQEVGQLMSPDAGLPV